MKAGFFSTWYTKNKRKFPWRKRGVQPFHILLTEMLLRQTRAEAVAEIWEGLLVDYAEPRCLAIEKRKRLHRKVSVLGFGHQRTEALLSMARWLVKNCNGEVPPDLDQLLSIPHVGHYSARAVLCFAYNKRVEIVDTNILRFLGRYYGISYQSPDIRRNPWAWKLARSLLPCNRRKIKQHNYGLLDFTAAICKAKNPTCPICPLRHSCKYGIRVLSV